jgi:hypothetical protein
MLFGSATHLFFPYTPWYHFVAGEFDELGTPTGFQFTTDQAWFEFMVNACAYEAVLFELNYFQIMCDSEDVPWDDYLGEITVPIFGIGAAGGLGKLSGYTIGLTASTDVTTTIVELYSPDHIAADYGHIDIFIADNAQSLVWMPVLDWINDHSCSSRKGGHGWKKDE